MIHRKILEQTDPVKLAETILSLQTENKRLRKALKEAEIKQGFCFACGEALEKRRGVKENDHTTTKSLRNDA